MMHAAYLQVAPSPMEEVCKVDPREVDMDMGALLRQRLIAVTLAISKALIKCGSCDVPLRSQRKCRLSEYRYVFWCRRCLWQVQRYYMMYEAGTEAWRNDDLLYVT